MIRAALLGALLALCVWGACGAVRDLPNGLAALGLALLIGAAIGRALLRVIGG